VIENNKTTFRACAGHRADRSGKSTTLASLLDEINHTSSKHILTIEDPIEFVYQSDRSLIHQRQLNEDTKSLQQCPQSSVA